MIALLKREILGAGGGVVGLLFALGVVERNKTTSRIFFKLFFLKKKVCTRKALRAVRRVCDQEKKNKKRKPR